MPINNLKSISPTCAKCQGKCWNDNSSIRQETVRKTYGSVLPNDCVDSEIDVPKCQYHK